MSGSIGPRIRFVAKIAYRSSNANGLLEMLAWGAGATAMHHAAYRGDIEIVELLLQAGADPSLKNDLGQDSLAMSASFPELVGMLEKQERMRKMQGRKIGPKMIQGLTELA